MRRRVLLRPRAAGVEKRSFLAPLVIGLGIWAGFPTVAAYQDMTGMISGSESAAIRWKAVVKRSVAGSIHKAEMPFVDADITTGTISGAGLDAPGIGAVAFMDKNGVPSQTPDEARVNRQEKQGRVVQVTPVAPPKKFNAGSVFERSSSLLDPGADREMAMAFVDPDIKGKEVAIAAAFHAKQPPRAGLGVPAMLASLVTSEKADILATAYAPAEPDYAVASPFESLIREDKDPYGGRFVPPLGAGDHAWMGKPLPASVFTSGEQECLAQGIYFEARGENLKGQAAVAQVILNRVRNPTYPNTICGVVYQNKTWRNRCQFSFACDGARDRVRSPGHYRTAQDIAMAVTAGKIFIPEVGSATHYHATYVHPRWSRTMEKMKKIGLHIFYRTHGGGWS
ncbi:MAG: cell wall hydrolase [Rhizobiaceae bacterium]|nr:cell wall hydrolase [Rhizobiaceae bacterium]